MKRVSVDQLANEIINIIGEYTDEVEEGLEKVKEKVAKEGAKTLKQVSPKRSGKYARGWRATKEDKDWVIHNANRYQVAHLLEKGHALRGGGRVSGKPHIAPTEEKVIKMYEDEVEKVIKG